MQRLNQPVQVKAGKGFAVVANEVKDLANQTAKATEEITKEIENIQGISKEVAEGLGTITESIEQVKLLCFRCR